jgi:hypothetical protein
MIVTTMVITIVRRLDCRCSEIALLHDAVNHTPPISGMTSTLDFQSEYPRVSCKAKWLSLPGAPRGLVWRPRSFS